MATKKPAKAGAANGKIKTVKDIAVKKASAVKGGRRRLSDPDSGDE